MLQPGRVEEVGSGMRNVYKYLPHYTKTGKAEFNEDDIFKTTILLTDANTGLVEKLAENEKGLAENFFSQILSNISCYYHGFLYRIIPFEMLLKHFG